MDFASALKELVDGESTAVWSRSLGMKFRLAGATALFCLLPVCRSLAHPAMAWSVPSERLIRNISAYLKDKPNDATARYSLGRVYYAAFLSDDDNVAIYGHVDESKEPVPTQEYHLQLWNAHSKRGDGGTAKPTGSASPTKIDELRLAITNLKTAIRLQPDDPTFHLTLASVYEDGLPIASETEAALAGAVKGEAMPLPVAESREAVAARWRKLAAEQYLRGFELGYDTDMKHGKIYGAGSAISEEAARGYLRVARTDPKVIANPDDLSRVQKGAKALADRPNVGITPIVFSLRRNASYHSVVRPDHAVPFDLDGTGKPQRYSWLKPDTGMIVWDPDGTGRITSGRQLFGSVTWWIFWTNGYRALDALDDSRDGKLSGVELKGIGVWFDRNGDGICEPGEVVSLASLGIKAISCRASGREDGTLFSRTGIEMQNGDTLKSWDWIATPVSSRSVAASQPPPRRTQH